MVALLGVLFVANVSLGSVMISVGDLLGALSGKDSVDPIISQIVIEFRFPQALTALLSGAALAVSGLLMQTIFRNPLADPFVLGVSSGASLGV